MKLRKGLSVFLLLVLILPFTGCQQNTTSGEILEKIPEGMVAVYLLTEENHEYTSDQLSTGFTYEYDVNGNMTVRKEYLDGAVIDHRAWEYDERNNRISYIHYSDGEISSITRQEYEYDSGGNLLTHIEYDNDGEEFSRRTYTYDANSNKIREEFTSGSTYVVFEFEYDSVGRMIKTILKPSGLTPGHTTEYVYEGDLLKERHAYSENRTEIERDIYQYDSKGNLLEFSFYNHEELCRKEVYQYDDLGNKIRCEITDKRGTKTAYTWEYNNKNLPIKCLFYKDDVLKNETEYTYNSEGILIKELEKYDSTTCTSTYRYNRLILSPEQAEIIQKANANSDGKVFIVE